MRAHLVWVTVLSFLGMAQSTDCDAGYWQCRNGKCIYEKWYCDSQNDCGDSSDEPTDCSHCLSGTWLCINSNCIPTMFLCDGDDDCGDGSDELDLVTGKCPTCPDNYFQCQNGRCAPGDSVCDGVNNCKDGSDERKENGTCILADAFRRKFEERRLSKRKFKNHTFSN